MNTFLKKKIIFIISFFIVFYGNSIQNYKNNIIDEFNIKDKNILKVPLDFSNIAEAVKIAEDGDYIIISPGVYYENEIEITKSITISSEWRLTDDKSKIKETIIDAGNKKLFSINKDDVEISGLTIINGDHPLDINAKASIIYNHLIRNLDAISFETGSGGYAAYNIIENDRDDGIDLDIGINESKGIRGSDILIEHNIILNSNDDGIEIRLFRHPNQNIKYEIRENVIIGSKNAAIQIISYDVYTGKEFHIHHNVFRNCKVGLGCMGGRNTREDLTGASKMDERVFLYNNTIIDNQMGATGGNNIIAFNNILMNNELGGFKLFGNNSIILNNLFYNNGYSEFIEIGESVIKKENFLDVNPLIDANTFELSDNSPCIDAGIKKIKINSDTFYSILSNYIIGTNPDLGAIEKGKKHIIPNEFELIVNAGSDIVHTTDTKEDIILEGKITNFKKNNAHCYWKLEAGENNLEFININNSITKVLVNTHGIYELSLNCEIDKNKVSDYITLRVVKDGKGGQCFIDDNNILKANEYAYSYGKIKVNYESDNAEKKYVELFSNENSKKSMLEYFIGTSKHTDSYIWLLVKVKNTKECKLKIEFNKKLSDTFSIDTNTEWKWIKVPGTYSLTAGEWPFIIKNLEGVVSIKKILFSYDSDFLPEKN